MAIYSRPSLTWEDLPFLRERTRLPIVLKGILHREDAERALDHGMDGIVVSNHGGRQVDGAIATLDAARDPRGGRRPRAGAARQRDPWRRRRLQGARAGTPGLAGHREPVGVGASEQHRARGHPERGRRARPDARPGRRLGDRGARSGRAGPRLSPPTTSSDRRRGPRPRGGRASRRRPPRDAHRGVERARRACRAAPHRSARTPRAAARAPLRRRSAPPPSARPGSPTAPRARAGRRRPGAPRRAQPGGSRRRARRPRRTRCRARAMRRSGDSRATIGGRVADQGRRSTPRRSAIHRPAVIPALDRDGDCLSDFVLPFNGSIGGAQSVRLAFDDDYEVTRRCLRPHPACSPNG